MWGKKSQYATEYLIVFSFSVLILLPGILILMDNSSDLKYTVDSHMAYTASNKIVDSATEIYYLGEGSKKSLLVTLPSNIVNTSVEGKELLFEIRGPMDIRTDVFSISLFNLSGTLPNTSGIHKIILKSEGDHVSIN